MRAQKRPAYPRWVLGDRIYCGLSSIQDTGPRLDLEEERIHRSGDTAVEGLDTSSRLPQESISGEPPSGRELNCQCVSWSVGRACMSAEALEERVGQQSR